MTERRPWFERVLGGGLRVLGLVPWPVMSLFGWIVGEIGYWLARPARRIALINVGLCFPELTMTARRRLVKRHFRVLGQSVMGVARAWWSSEAQLQRFVRVRDREFYDAAIAAGRNVILLAPHFLGLEIGGLRLSLERDMISMYKPPKTVLAGALLHRRWRFGATLWATDAPLRSLVRAIRARKPFYYLPDLDPGTADAVMVPFFGVETATLTALSRLATLTDAVVIPCVTRKLPGTEGFEVTFKAPLADFPSLDPVADATQMNEAIEEAIRTMPEQYLWTYRRFKRCRVNGRSVYE